MFLHHMHNIDFRMYHGMCKHTLSSSTGTTLCLKNEQFRAWPDPPRAHVTSTMDRVQDLLAENEGLIADNDTLRALKGDCNKLSDENNELTIRNTKLQRKVDSVRAALTDADDS